MTVDDVGARGRSSESRKMPTVRWSVACMLLSGFALSACGDDSIVTTAAHVTTVTEGVSMTATPGRGSLRHRAIYLSDVQTIPDEPVSRGYVIVVPDGRINAFWTAVGLSSGGPDLPSKAEFRVNVDELPTGVEVAAVSAGTFRSSAVAPGALLCLADDQQSESDTHQVSGCALVPAGPNRPIVLSAGIAGVQIRVS